MRKYLPGLALFLVYAAVNLHWQWRMTLAARANAVALADLSDEIRALRAGSVFVTHEQMRSWIDEVNVYNNNRVPQPTAGDTPR